MTMNSKQEFDDNASFYTAGGNNQTFTSDDDNMSVVSDVDAQTRRFINMTSIVNNPEVSMTENLVTNLKSVLFNINAGIGFSKKVNSRLLKVQDEVSRRITIDSFKGYIG